ncbi:fibronectin type III domain-containing protein 5 [Cricetulus griseus]|uniref:Fibronectin type III domain-containing protein 5 n=1 Tax=Cricetulus griseus TaxID=10029 RepID=A0A9J7GN82_CRIGR|nr:fibronectin type III domain-containing protein 5 [Cricetulus griseus]
MPPGPPCAWRARAALRLWLGCVCFALVQADSPSAPVNVTVRHLKANSAVVSWDVLEDEVVIGFAISQQKKDVRMLRFIQEVNTTTRSCALWDLEEDTEYIVHVQAISIQGQSPASEPLLFKTPREAEKMASKNKDEVTMKEMGRNQQLRTGEVLIIVVVLFMWAGVIALFCRQYDIIKDNEPNNNKEKTKSASETSTPEHQGGGLLRSKWLRLYLETELQNVRTSQRDVFAAVSKYAPVNIIKVWLAPSAGEGFHSLLVSASFLGTG